MTFFSADRNITRRRAASAATLRQRDDLASWRRGADSHTEVDGSHSNSTLSKFQSALKTFLSFVIPLSSFSLQSHRFKEEFQQFRRTDESRVVMLITSIVVTGILLHTSKENLAHSDFQNLSVKMIGFNAISIIVSIMTIVTLIFRLIASHDQVFTNFPFLLTFSLNLTVVHYALSSTLISLDVIVIFHLLTVMMMYFVFKDISYRQVVYSMCLSFVFDVLLLFWLGSHQSYILITVVFILSLFIVFEYHRQCWKYFCLVSKTTLQPEDELKFAFRNMIGNVAHDLKTPLTSFSAGVEVIRTLVNEVHSDLSVFASTQTLCPSCNTRKTSFPPSLRSISPDSSTNSDSSEKLLGKLSTILEVAENVTNTNAFMIMTINRCIDYNKTLFGLQLTPKPEVFFLKDCVDFTVKCLKNSYDQVSIVCEYLSDALKEGDVMLKTDKQWLQENLLCLVGNAAKYSHLPSLVKVSIAADDTAIPKLHFAVLDNGPGISSEFQSKLFEEPTQAARINGGTGLGLYSLAKRVDALNGEYGVRNRMDIDGQSGSEFWFTLPFEQIMDQKVAKTKETSDELESPLSPMKIHIASSYDIELEGSQLGSSTRSKALTPSKKRSPRAATSKRSPHERLAHVLVVDDSPLILKMTSLALRKRGYFVTTAEDGKQAVRVIEESLNHKATSPSSNRNSHSTASGRHHSSQSSIVDVILMDFQMPVVDGVTAILEIRTMIEKHNNFVSNSISESSEVDSDIIKYSPYPSPFIIGCSAKSDDCHIQEAFTNGMNAFLPKPFTMTAFQALVNSHVYIGPSRNHQHLSVRDT